MERPTDTLRLATVNARGAFDYAYAAGALEQLVERIDADVMVITEAYREYGTSGNPDFGRDSNFTSRTVAYNDAEPHPSGEQHMMVIARRSLQPQLEPVWLDTRYGVQVELRHPRSPAETIDGVAFHYDDRDPDTRIHMAVATIGTLSTAAEVEPTARQFALGRRDCVAPDDWRAPLLDNPLSHRLAAYAPTERGRSLSIRLSYMGNTGPASYLEAHGLHDADVGRDNPSTMTVLGGRLGAVMLDGIYHNDGFASDGVFTDSDRQATPNRALITDLHITDYEALRDPGERA